MDYKSRSKIYYGTSNTGTCSTLGNSTSLNDDVVGSNSISISSLNCGTTYYYCVASLDAGGNSWYTSISSAATSACSGGGGGGGFIGGIPPVISSIEVDVGTNQATITWSTNELSLTWLTYGLTSDYGEEEKSTDYTTSHSVTLTGLDPATTYHYQIKARDRSGNESSYTDKTFTTLTVEGEEVVEEEEEEAAATPEDYNLAEGNLIRAEGDHNVYIINQHGYKRLLLNVEIFAMYAHLGGWEAVNIVSAETRDAFVTSHYYRYVGSPKVYYLEITGEDTGVLHWLNMTAEEFINQGGDFNAVFIINEQELNWYPVGDEMTSL